MIKSVVISMLIVYIMNTSPRWSVHGIGCIMLNIILVAITTIIIESFAENIKDMFSTEGGEEIE